MAYYNRALSYSDAGREDKAVSDFTKAIEYDPMCYDAYSNRGMAYYHLDKFDQALDDFEQTIKMRPEFFGNYFHKALVYIEKEEFDEALALCEKSMNMKSSDDANLYIHRGYIYHQKKCYTKALTDYNKAIELKPRKAQYYRQRAFLFEDISETAKAAADHETYRRIDYMSRVEKETLDDVDFDIEYDSCRFILDENESYYIENCYFENCYFENCEFCTSATFEDCKDCEFVNCKFSGDFYLEVDEEIPKSFFSLTSLTGITIHECNVIPPEIKKIHCLKKFVVDGAGFLEYLPCEIGELSLLEELVLKESRSPTPNGFQPLRSLIKEIPSQIGRLGSLKILSIPHSSLTSVPQALSKIFSLTKIDLHDNKLQEFSTENFPFLTHLNLCQNELTEFPIQIANSPLTFLDISNNNIAIIPREIGKMSSLSTLNLAQNNLKEIPKEISLLSSLQELNLSKNNLQELPIEIIQLRNLKTLMLSGNTVSRKMCTFLKDRLPKECTLVL
ncbi:tetratricopeptide repeat protein [Candidatus Uabimicrobium sp. HlEnr_7]|uniref:tetratricopeptide repeat protein n=1 Tax=Candidatus Uabimicrobium helgolandensis TaxID=3095367 RepID=UPI003558C5BA